MSPTHPNAPILSLRVTQEMKQQLEALAEATGRSKSFLATEALQNYLKIQAWQIKVITKAVKKANDKKAKFIEHTAVATWLESWGTDREEEPPK